MANEFYIIQNCQGKNGLRLETSLILDSIMIREKDEGRPWPLPGTRESAFVGWRIMF